MRERVRGPTGVNEYKCKRRVWVSSRVWERACSHEYVDVGEHECQRCVLMDVGVCKSEPCDNGLRVRVAMGVSVE